MDDSFEAQFFALFFRLRGHVHHHVCKVCGKEFTDAFNLKTHMMIHGEMPYVCPICDKGFRWKQSLNAHMMTHKVEKPHMCPTCDKSFRWKQNLSVLSTFEEKDHF